MFKRRKWSLAFPKLLLLISLSLALNCDERFFSFPMAHRIALGAEIPVGQLLRNSIVQKLLSIEGAADGIGLGLQSLKGFGKSSSKNFGLQGDVSPELEKVLTEIGSEIARNRGRLVGQGIKIDFTGALTREEESIVKFWVRRKLGQEPESTLRVAQASHSALDLRSVESGALRARATLAQRKLFTTRLSDQFKGMAACLKNSPPAVRAASNWDQYVRSVGSATLVTTLAYAWSTPMDRWNASEIGTDLLMNFVRYGVRTMGMSRASSVGKMYVNLLAVNGVMNAVDSVVYHEISQGDQNAGNWHVRHAYNQAWNVAVSNWMGPSLMIMGEGFKCLYPQSRFVDGGGLFWSYFVIDMGVSSVYYYIRDSVNSQFDPTRDHFKN